MRRSYLAALLAAVIALSLIPVAAFASGTPEATSEQALRLLSTPLYAADETDASAAAPSTEQADPADPDDSLADPGDDTAELPMNTSNVASVPVGDAALIFSLSGGSAMLTGCEGIIVGPLHIPQQIAVGDVTYPVTALATGAFAGQRQMTQVTIPASVEEIGYRSFSGNSALQAIHVDANNVGGYYDKDGVLFRRARVDNVQAVVLCVYPAGKTNVTQYAVPDGTATLDHYAFSGNGTLTAITFPDSLKVVGDHAFDGCASLQRATLPADVIVGSDLFQGCSMLTQATSPEDTAATAAEDPDETTDASESGDPTAADPDPTPETPSEGEPTPSDNTGDEPTTPVDPTGDPSEAPSEEPSESPSDTPTGDPSEAPSESPSDTPTGDPSEEPSESPSDTPTGDPSEAPSESPSDTPTGEPSEEPSESPSDTPTGEPSDDPSESPSDTPTGDPSEEPSESPSDTPTGEPSDDPSESPSDTPTGEPSDTPSESPSSSPTPSPSPTPKPTTRPSSSRPVVSVISTPTAAPTDEKVSVSSSAAESAVSASSDGTVTLKPQIGAGKSALISLPVNAISQAVRVKDGKVEQIAVSTPLATVTLSRAALESLVAQADGTSATLRVALQDIPDGAKSVVGDHSAYDLTFRSAKNTEISTFGGALVTVSIPYRLAAGERGENITVVHVKENGETERVPFSSWRDGQLVFETRHLSTYAVAHLPSTFSDSTGHWAAADISYAASRGLLIGVSQQAFHPSGSVSWKMALTVLGRMDGVEPDPAAAWYNPYLDWAEEHDLLPYAQDPDESIERQEMAKLLAQFLALHGQAPTAGTIPPSSYLDRKAIGARYIADVGYLREVGLMRGHADGTFGPQDYLTRAQFATLLRRLVDWELGWSIR